MNVKIWINDELTEKDYDRVFLLSDIHNHYDSYCQLKEKLHFTEKDLIIVAGDIVDRGPNPLGLLSEIRFAENRSYDVIMLKGNHEQWLARDIIKYCQTGKDESHYNSLSILSKQLSLEELCGYAEWMSNLPLGLIMKIEGYRKKFRIAHASTIDLTSTDESLMGSYNFYLKCLYDRKYINVVGHTVTSIVREYFEDFESEGEKDNTDIFRIGMRLWCIDCGNGYRDNKYFPGKLGCIELLGNKKIYEHYV